ncbi:MAG: toll/interleukin-1 receptor domain-containing protein [Candidatus Dadabacteria bacterium]|nr:toll/interleukin-1 receptor domain-containing protein [Candidatus Dadabacteria bacterium]
MPETTYDVFFSYVHAEKDEAHSIVKSLRAKGLSVWLDENRIGNYEGIMENITEGLSNSKALVAYYSTQYPKSRYCQWELTSAFLAGQRQGDPISRIMVINPNKDNYDHIMPVELQGALFKHAPEKNDPDAMVELVESIERRISGINTPLGRIITFDKPPWKGRTGIFYSDFVGRLKEMWDVHSKLNSFRATLVTGGKAQMRGIGGGGKSLLVEEYAMRYGAGYPGGIYWISATGADPKNPERELERKLRDLALEIGINIEKDDGLLQIRGNLGRHIENMESPSLWIVDDVPVGMDNEKLRLWFAPHGNAHTLLTTRSTEYTVAKPVDLGMLEKNDAYQLITNRKKPTNDDEENAAWKIIEMLGYHALAVDVTASALQYQGFSDFLKALKNPAEDELELTAELSEQLPNGHEPSIASTLLRSIKKLEDEGTDFLRLASILSVALIPTKLVEGVFAILDELIESEARKKVLLSLKQVNSHSLATTVEGEAWEVHTLVSRTMRFHDKGDEAEARRSELLDAVIRVLSYILSKAIGDIRLHKQITHEVILAGDLVKHVNTLEKAHLAGWVGRYDYERGDYKSAREFEEKVLETRKRVLGEEHPDTLASMNNLAGTLGAQGDLKRARELQEKVLETRKRVLGEEHPDTLTSMNNLAGTLGAQGDLNGARELQEKVLEIAKRVLGEEHPDTLTSMNNLAGTLRAQGDLKGARELQEKVLETHKRVLGERHTDTTISAWNLFLLHSELKDMDSAKRVLQNDIRWLLNEDPVNLSADQQYVRDQVAQLVENRK